MSDPLVLETVTEPLALICSVELEAEPVRALLHGAAPAEVGRRPATRGALAGRPVVLLVGGMGKTNAAQSLTALLEGERVGGVIGFGVGGAYAGSGLSVGSLALATSEAYGDEGVAAPEGWLSTEQIGIPLLVREGAPVYNVLPLHAERVRRAERALRESGCPAIAGPFVTVSCCSGTAARGAELAARFHAVCESMEGAAYAHVAALYQLPLLQVRGISNRVEDRDLSGWRLRQAAGAAARAVEVLAAHWDEPPD